MRELTPDTITDAVLSAGLHASGDLALLHMRPQQAKADQQGAS
jgi:hypothetical protein